jgi:hypothetical protein
MAVDELAPLRRVEQMLRENYTLDEIVAELEVTFELDFVDAMSVIAATTLVNERGLAVPAPR